MIKDRIEAINCVSTCAAYLRRVDDSPRAAADLRDAVNMLARPHLVITTDNHILNVVEILATAEGTIIKVESRDGNLQALSTQRP